MLKLLFIILLFYTSLQANVYFTKDISPSSMVKIFKKLNVTLTGKVGLKVHSGEIGGKYFLHPNFLQEIYDYTQGTFIECNTAYKRGRHTTELHKELLKDHGWLDNGRRTVIMDEDPSADFNLTINNPGAISENIVGEHLKDFDSCIVLSHLKGHGMGGFGGALKQLSIGFASQAGKTWIHTAGASTNWTELFTYRATQERFTTAMGDAASSIVEYFKNKGDIAFINVMANISKSCDCAGGNAPEPKIQDIGILASTDPVALDRACIDMINKTEDPGTSELLTQVEDLLGLNTIVVAEKHGIGKQEYTLVDIDESDDDKKEEEDKKEEDDKKEEQKSKEEEKKEDDGNNTGLVVIICVSILVIITALIVGYIFYKKKKMENSGDIGNIMPKTD